MISDLSSSKNLITTSPPAVVTITFPNLKILSIGHFSMAIL